MKNTLACTDPIEILKSARTIAGFASSEGFLFVSHRTRLSCSHVGAVLADSILQAGDKRESTGRSWYLEPRVDRGCIELGGLLLFALPT